MTFNWDDIRVFLAVARAESLSGAGKALALDPATIGRRVARLEATQGTPLFAKSPQGYAMTDAGQRLLAQAERVEQAMQGVREEIAGQCEGLSGQIRIGAPDGCANFLLPQVCAAIMGDNPGLEIQIVALPRVFSLTRREADMVVAVSPPTAGRLSVQKITDYRLHLAASEAYLAHQPPIQTSDDLKDHRVVGYIQDMIFDKELDYLSQARLERAGLSSNSVSVQINMIGRGAGVGIVHDFSVPFIPGIRRILTEEISLTRSFYLVRHEDDRRLERMTRFADLLTRGLRDEVRRLEALL